MVEYKCDRCGKIYNHKNNFRKHLNRKYPCIPIENNEDNHFENNENNDFEDHEDSIKNMCTFCHKTFSCKFSLTRHLKSSCSVRIKVFNLMSKICEIDELILNKNCERQIILNSINKIINDS